VLRQIKGIDKEKPGFKKLSAMKKENTDRIESYMDGSLTASERERFEEDLKADKILAGEFEYRKRIAFTWQKAKIYAGTKKEVSDAIMNERSKSKRRIAGYSIAASFFVITFLSVVLLYSRVGNHPEHVVDNEEETITPRFKIPEEKASAGTIAKFVLLFPAGGIACSRNDSLVFHWSPALADSSFIIIGNEKSKNLVYREKLEPGKISFKLDRHFLPVGEYNWQVEGFPANEKFKIINK